jgi:protein-L-isoaspartate(D-aspartate) O-methyltransferase
MLKRHIDTTTLLRKFTRKQFSMAWYCSGTTNTELIENLSKEGLIKNDRVKKAMMGVSITLLLPLPPPSIPNSSSPRIHRSLPEFLTLGFQG